MEKRNLSQKLRKVLNIESLRFMEIKEYPHIKKREKRDPPPQKKNKNTHTQKKHKT